MLTFRLIRTALYHHRISRTLLAAPLAALSLLTVSPSQADYRQIARDQTAYIQAHYYDSAAKKYKDAFPPDPKGSTWTTTWPNSIELWDLVQAAQDNPSRYKPILNSFGEGLRDYWNQPPMHTPPAFAAYCAGPGDHMTYYDDNAWMVLDFLDAYNATHDRKYLKWAQETQTFVESGWDDKLGGGIYWNLNHESKNSCVNGPAAVAALRLAALGDIDQAAWATKIVTWENSALKNNDDLYWDNISLNGNVSKWEWSYNTALMIEAETLLYQTRGDQEALREAERSADASIKTWQDPNTGAFCNDASFTSFLCESLLQLYAVDHNVDYLNAVRRHAAFGYRYVRDTAGGGYWNSWKIEPHMAGERKLLIENAADARIFWLLATYPDPDQLYAQGMKDAASGDILAAQDLLEQSADSDTENVDARYQLWRLFLGENNTQEAAIQENKLMSMSANPQLLQRLTALGWVPVAPAAGGPGQPSTL